LLIDRSTKIRVRVLSAGGCFPAEKSRLWLSVCGAREKKEATASLDREGADPARVHLVRSRVAAGVQADPIEQSLGLFQIRLISD
jgi:hypothetical protein